MRIGLKEVPQKNQRSKMQDKTKGTPRSIYGVLLLHHIIDQQQGTGVECLLRFSINKNRIHNRLLCIVQGSISFVGTGEYCHSERDNGLIYPHIGGQLVDDRSPSIINARRCAVCMRVYRHRLIRSRWHRHESCWCTV
jgi:hypothetical protein